MSKALIGLIVFTAIEVVGLVLWLIFAGVPFKGGYREVLAVVILTVFLLAEHYVSIQVGAGRPLFGPLPPDKE